MEGIINLQTELQRAIDKGYTNFKKSPKDRIKLEYIEIRLENLDRDWQLFRTNNSKLYENFKPNEIESSFYVTSEIYEKTEEIYIMYKAAMKIEINKLQAHNTNDCNTKASNNGGESSSSFVKLPKICIPLFSGKYSEWPTFRDLFTSLVHKNKTLDSVQKLHYLKGHLTGEAEQLIRHTPITEANYGQCWELLEKRYNNKRYLANCILKRLFSQKRLHFEYATGLKELLDNTSDCLNALKNLNVDVSTWDIIIIHIVNFKLDGETRKQWELSVSTSDSNELPTLEQFKTFIENRFRALECLDSKRSVVHQASTKSLLATATSPYSNQPGLRCEFCSEGHKLCFCKSFTNQTTEQRREFVAKNKICFNCLGGNHTTYNCKKPTTCKICKRRHHSLLHLQSRSEDKINLSPEKDSTAISPKPSASTSQIVSCLSTGKVQTLRQVLLATALINAESVSGEHQIVRALLDQGSQACFITEATVQLLRLKKHSVHGIISGLGQNKSIIAKYTVNFIVQSRIDPVFKIPITAYVLNNITSYLPEKHAKVLDWVELKCLPLADPKFTASNKIDILLGAEIYSNILREGLRRNPSGTLIAQNTTLGWIISGTVDTVSSKNNNSQCLHISVDSELTGDNMLRKFWEIEEQPINIKATLTEEEQRCEELFETTTRRTPEGRYVVKLPFRDEQPQCANFGSREIAEIRFKALEKRLTRNEDLKEKYTDVIKEYLTLGHMRRVMSTNKIDAVYLPHHAVIRNDKRTTKVRVVFNASEKNRKGISLNDTLMVGPTLQADLRHTVLRWRIHPIALVADITKMYRQVCIADEDAKYQRILWRDEPEKEISDYELLTVTFGTASGPYLAVRALQQIAHDAGDQYPLASDKVLNNFYIDDLMSGCSSVEEGLEVYSQISGLLESGGFKLQKWDSNNAQLKSKIEGIEQEKEMASDNNEMEYNKDNTTQDNTKLEIDNKGDHTIKILGLTWNRNDDFFQYSVILPLATAPATKRAIISDISRFYDPLGWIAPTIVIAKMFIQKLWIAGVGWDEHLAPELLNEWNTYRNTLVELSKIHVPRWVGRTPDDIDVELHGFCDASKFAYAAVTYIRIIDNEGKIKVALLNAKTRVAPIKQISIPRLELCGAVLLSRLLIETSNVLNIPVDKIRAWTDSTIVLAWLNSHPSRWKTFVANRTSEILTTMNSSQWFHISTKQNPADLASRGVGPHILAESEIWFQGPELLWMKNIIYERPSNYKINLEESIRSLVTTAPEISFIERFSSLQRLCRVIAFCRRFLKRGKEKGQYLLKKEIDVALQCCIRHAQLGSFPLEYAQLQDTGILKLKSSPLKSLCPYLDSNNILRLRGRIQKSQLEDNIKHPIVLPATHHLTKLIIADAHFKTLHGGPQLMTNYLRSAYWIISGRKLIKRHVRECISCVRQRADVKPQFMGSLPSARCSPARPFLHTGVDYAGPISVRTSKGRGHRSYKGYISLFVCMCTRAIHLELVSDMTTQGFLAAFKRFTARRGHCAQLWSDNGSTFIGAGKELQQWATIQSSTAQHLEANKTEWHFIPPHAPNFGGLWEAGVKSTKFHLKRVIGESTLTFEEMSTLLSQVEACLNSRPISVINSDDPGEPLPLTPGHFLIGEPLLTVPEPNYEHSPISSLSRWQFIQRAVQTFWRRWSHEYLVTMMNRYKWHSQVPEPKIGQVVLVKEDDLPPSRWLLGRILEKHPGSDGISRVVTLRTKTSIVKRPTSKLCVLPIAD